ncbi:FHA domain-containing protein [Oceanicoccus sp. KOV_DT_Chl]|uniref:FHA domain-containing protein n=1 Tax=Oceanicoccus sp. KOV_DT_Chl TaxID=1904639 RepID=UPI000C79C064|nr:FHA domain-containing protein [Oceanicoccus sp. KOV_DT_Chl]
MAEDKTKIRGLTQTFSLRGLAGNHKNKVYPVSFNFKIGREQDNNLIINEGFVSRHHAVVKSISGC